MRPASVWLWAKRVAGSSRRLDGKPSDAGVCALAAGLTLAPTLATYSYEGVYTKRTGDRRDGLAMFWRADAVRPGEGWVLAITRSAEAWRILGSLVGYKAEV